MLKEFPQSKNLRCAEYDTTSQELKVTFLNGSQYVYTNVPLDVVKQFYEAPSAGSFLATHIKNKYSFAKIKNAAVKEA